MKRYLFLVLGIFAFACLGFLTNSKTKAENNNISSGEPKHGLVLVLRVEPTTIKSGKIPTCIMEVKNISNKTILISESFSFNGPSVYDEHEEPCKHRIYIELPEGHQFNNLKLEPGKNISVKTTPNYRMDIPGKYTLYFSMYPATFGYPKENAPDIMVPAGEWENPVVSNKIVVEVVK